MNTWLEWQSEAWPRIREHQGTGRVWVCVSARASTSLQREGYWKQDELKGRGKVKWCDSGRREGFCEEPQEGCPMVPWQLLENTQEEEGCKLHPWQVWAEVLGMVRCEFQPKACSSVALGCTMEAEVSLWKPCCRWHYRILSLRLLCGVYAVGRGSMACCAHSPAGRGQGALVSRAQSVPSLQGAAGTPKEWTRSMLSGGILPRFSSRGSPSLSLLSKKKPSSKQYILSLARNWGPSQTIPCSLGSTKQAYQNITEL